MFGITDYPAFAAAIVVFLAIPGPGTFTLLTATAQGGPRAGAAATVGLIAGDQVLLWLAVAGVSAALAAYPLAFHAIQWGGALYLAWLGSKLLLSRQGAATLVRLQPHRYGRQAFVITLLNPKAIVFYMAFFPLFIDPAVHAGPRTFVAMAVTIASITAIYCLLLCAVGTTLSQRLGHDRRLTRWAERLAGVLLIGFGLRLVRG